MERLTGGKVHAEIFRVFVRGRKVGCADDAPARGEGRSREKVDAHRRATRNLIRRLRRHLPLRGRLTGCPVFRGFNVT